ncbi:MAG: hypothetical protein VCA36_09395, partial [Opitutales bacterium]
RSNYQVSAVTAACILMEKETFLECGGFDEEYLNGLEDVDLCLRLSERGYRHFVCPSSRVRHWVGATRGRNQDAIANVKRFRRRWGGDRLFCPKEWAWAYLSRYCGRPWQLNPLRVIRALFYLLRGG